MVFLTRHEESIKVRPWFAFYQFIQYIEYIDFNPLQPLSLFEHLLEFLLLLPLPKAFWFFWFPNFVLSQKTKVCYIFSFSSPFAKKNSPRTNRLNSFCVSLLPFPKERRTNRLNSFVSLLPCQRIQNDTVWEFFWFFPFHNTKVCKGLTAWEFFCIPIHKVSKV